MDEQKAAEALRKPIPAGDIKSKPKSFTQRKQQDGTYPEGTKALMVNYIDARLVMERLDEAVSPFGWSWECAPVQEAKGVVHGKLTVNGITKEDFGYPNSDNDEEPYKSAASDAIKRCAVHFGIGRDLYDMEKRYVEVDKYGKPLKGQQARPSQPAAPASPAPEHKPQQPNATSVPVNAPISKPASQKQLDLIAKRASGKEGVITDFLEKNSIRADSTENGLKMLSVRQASALIDLLAA